MKLDLTFKKNNEELMSSWEIGNFLDKYGSYYYKMNILEEIKEKLVNGVTPEQIFILDESFNLHHKYIKLGVDTNKTIEHLYAIGLPSSMYPNRDIELMGIVFHYFRYCNEILRKSAVKVLPLSELHNIRKQIVKHQDINALLSDILDKIQSRYSDEIETSVIERINKKLQKKKQEVLAIYEEYIRKEVYFDRIKVLINEGEFQPANLSKAQKEIYEQYFGKFFHYFEKVSRPLVCIFEEDKIEVLGKQHVNRDKRDESFLDIKRVSHNSPIEFNIVTDVVTGGKLVYEAIKDEKRKDEIHQLEVENKLNEIEKQKNELEMQEYDKQVHKIKLLDEILTTCEKHGIEGEEKEKLINSFLMNQVNAVSQRTQVNMQRLLQYNGLRIHEVNTIPHIDVRT